MNITKSNILYLHLYFVNTISQNYPPEFALQVISTYSTLDFSNL